MRRSSRQSAPTERGFHYSLSTASIRKNSFPSTSDEIFVKWMVRGRPVWWPATVLAVNQEGNDITVRFGKIKYHQFMKYQSEESVVYFCVDRNTFERYLFAASNSTTNSFGDVSTQADVCSWIFASLDAPLPSVQTRIDASTSSDPPSFSASPLSEPTSIDDPSSSVPTTRVYGMTRAEKNYRALSSTEQTGSIVNDSGSSPPTLNTRNNEAPASANTMCRGIRKKGLKNRKLRTSIGSQRPDRQPGKTDDKEVVRNNTAQQKLRFVATSSHSSKGQSYPLQSNANINTAMQSPQHANDEVAPGRSRAQSYPDKGELQQLKIRVELLESSLRDILQSDSAARLPASSLAVILSLKWSFLNRMEKPLKPWRSEGLSSHGIDSSFITVKVDCDSKVFKGISAFLAHRHRFINASNSKSTSSGTERINFIPDFYRTQSGSLGTVNQEIQFTNLPDVTDLLGIRDEDDYERILSKELSTQQTQMIRIVGSLDVFSPSASSATACSDQPIHESTTTTNEPSVIRVFVGTSPLDITQVGNCGHKQKSNLTSELHEDVSVLNSAVFEQTCLHFSLDKGCYRTTWRSRSMKSNFKFPFQSEDEKVDECEDNVYNEIDRGNFITMKWTKLKPPSSSKWTADAQQSRGVTPGRLTLSIPTVFSTSADNVKSLSALMDNAIEGFIAHRIHLQNTLAQPTITAS